MSCIDLQDIYGEENRKQKERLVRISDKENNTFYLPEGNTATVSQYFTIAELFALKEFMYKYDIRRMLQMAHQRYNQTCSEQWKHSEKMEQIL